MYTTINKIRASNPPCDGKGLGLLIDRVGLAYGDDKPIPMRVVLEAVGLFPAIWCLRTIDGHDDKKDEFKAFCDAGATMERITDKFLELFGE